MSYKIPLLSDMWEDMNQSDLSSLCFPKVAIHLTCGAQILCNLGRVKKSASSSSSTTF